jgi:long-subunit acyl-CoA synthetase (AMP-forming)
LDDIVELKPTVFCSVPRLFNRIYDRVLSGVKGKGGVAAALFFMAYEAKKANLKTTTKHWLWDRLVFGTVCIVYGVEYFKLCLLTSYTPSRFANASVDVFVSS